MDKVLAEVDDEFSALEIEDPKSDRLDNEILIDFSVCCVY